MLFCDIDSNAFFSNYYAEIKEEIKRIDNINIDDENILSLVNDFVSKYSIKPLSIQEEKIEKNVQSEKVKNDILTQCLSVFEIKEREEEGVCFTYKIPFVGDFNLFLIKPRKSIVRNFYTNIIEFNEEKKDGFFIIKQKFRLCELNEKENMREFIKDQFENEFHDYKIMIKYVNEEVLNFNNSLGQHILNLLKELKRKNESLKKITDILGIAVSNESNSCTYHLIEHENIINSEKIKKNISSSCISENDYKKINGMIYSFGTKMENDAKSYCKLKEEALRDVILLGLNSYYPSATGETFRKNGKTDIHIPFNESVFIAECKIWHGLKAFISAIEQLLSYTTWRDKKISMIIFNKNNMNFGEILKNIDDFCAKKTKILEKTKSNYWKCEYFCKKRNIAFCLSILVFDLYV